MLASVRVWRNLTRWLSLDEMVACMLTLNMNLTVALENFPRHALVDDHDLASVCMRQMRVVADVLPVVKVLVQCKTVVLNEVDVTFCIDAVCLRLDCELGW